MDLKIIIALLILLIVICYYIISSIFKSRWYANVLLRRDYKESQKLKENTVKEMERNRDLVVSDKDYLFEVIKKLKLKQEVKIPIEAFEYLYRNLDKFNLIDKHGRVTLLEPKDYELMKNFEEQAVKLLNKNKIEENKKDLINEKSKQKEFKLHEFFQYPDGRIEKVDAFTNKKTIINTKGEVRIYDSIKGKAKISNLHSENESKLNHKNEKQDLKKQDDINLNEITKIVKNIQADFKVINNKEKIEDIKKDAEKNFNNKPIIDNNIKNVEIEKLKVEEKIDAISNFNIDHFSNIEILNINLNLANEENEDKTVLQ